MRHLFWGNVPLLLLLVISTLDSVASSLTPAGQVGGVCLTGLKRCIQKNSECVEDKCLCSNFYRHVNGSCVSYSESTTLGEQCLSGGDCRGAGEFCSSFSICMCLGTHVDVGAQCKPAVYPGQFGCEDSRQCNKGFPGAECDSSRVCVCPHGMQANHQTCVVASSLSNTMLSDDQIARGLYQRSPQRMPSLNLPAHSRRRYSPTGLQGRGGVKPNDLCSVDSDCAGYPYAFCSGTCRCAQDALDAGETCIPQNKPSSMVCAPGQTWVSEAGACMTVQQPGEPCQYSQQCSAAESGAFCRRLKCECVYGMKASGAGCTFQSTNCSGRKGFIWIPEIGDCREVLPPGSSGCSHSLQCTEAFPEARCISGTCTCPFNAPTAIDGTCGTNCSAGETFSGVTGRCIPTVLPGDQCLYSSQCHALHPGMTCDRNRCRCPNGLVFTGNMCAQTCSSGYIADNRGICKPGCRPTQVEFEGECLDQATPSQPCQVNAQCTGGSSCQSGFCECPRAMTPRGAICVMIQSPPQGSCRMGESCSGGAICQNGVCVCPAGRQIVNGQCITPLTVPPNSPCGPSVVCGGASTCIAGFCACAANHQVINGECQIPALVAPGNPCPSGFERCMGQSICTNGVCECPVGTFPSQNDCLPVRYVQAGSPCSQTTKCIGLSQCIDGTCKCPAGLVIQDGDCRAASQVAPGSSCASGEVCSGGSFCIGLKCTCPPGTQEQNGACQSLTSAIPGQTCTNGEICTGGSNCQNGFCVCPLGMEIFLNNCQQTTSDLGQCDTLQQCSGGAYCDTVRNRCTCTPGTVAVGSFCVPTQDLKLQPASAQRACQYDSDCDDGRKCVLKQCQCQFGSELPDGTCRNLWVGGNNRAVRRLQESNVNHVRMRFSSLPKASPPSIPSSSIITNTNNVKIGGSCVHPNARCVPTADCIAGICVCGMGKTPVNNERCVEYRSANPGESCSRGEECVGGSRCDQQSLKCECEATHIRIGSQCTPRLRARPGYGCSNGEVCAFGSVCIRGNCVCPEGTVESRTRGEKQCVKEALPDTSCSNGEDCTGGSTCQSGVCRCERGQQIVNNHCVDVRVVNPSESCYSPLVRCGGGSFCVRGSCECPPHTIPKGESCVTPKQVAPGFACSSDDICMARSICKDGRCQCTLDMTLRNGHCVLKMKSYPGEPCQPGDECLGGSSCDGRKCLCPPGQIVSDGICSERQKVRPGLPCRSDDLCVGQSVCFEGLCQCRRGEKIIQGACAKFLQVLPGANCAPIDECLAGSKCTNGVCECPIGQIVVNSECKAIVKAVPGASCAKQEQCDGGSVCDVDRKVCLCKDGFQPRQGVCIRATPAERKPAAIKSTVVAPTLFGKKERVTSSPVPPSQLIRVAGPSTRPPAVVKAKPKLPAWLSILASTTTARPTRPQIRVCSINADCYKGATCIGGRCRCNPGTVLQNGVCAPIRGAMVPQRRKHGGLREACLSDAHCHVAYSYCVPEIRICGCRPGFRGSGSLIDMKCIPEPIRTTLTSTTVTTTTTELPTTTEAPTTTVLETTTTQKVEVTTADYRSIHGGLEVRAPKFVLPGQECDENSFCNMGSYCVNGVCQCAEDFTQEGNLCIRKSSHAIVRPLSNCSRGEVCGYSSECIHGICLCIGHFTLFRDECRTLDEIELIHRRETEEKLESNYIPPPRGAFRLKITTTPEPETTTSTISRPDSTTTAPDTTTEDIFVIMTEEPVTVDPITPPHVAPRTEIPPRNIVRDTSTQRTTTHQPVTEDQSELEALLKTPRPHFWFKVVSPGFECDELSFCSNCSVCLNGRCQCPEGLELIEARCMSPIDARQCVASNQCPSGADCVSGECKCKPGHALSRFGFCMPFTYVDPGMSCSEGEVCRGGSECREGMCACSEGLVIKENKCLPPIRVRRRIEQNLSILDKEFEDKMNQVESSAKRQQSLEPEPNQSTGRVPLGDRCSASSVCSHGGICLNGICKCPQNMVQAGISCLARETIGSSIALPGASCQEGIFCDGGASCVNYECKCPSGFAIDSSVCTPVLAKAGSSCNEGERCSYGSICVQGTCICPDGLREIDGNCVTISTNTKKSPGISCLTDPNICTGGSFCVQGICTCPLGLESVGGVCRQTNIGTVNYAAPGGACRDGQIICTGNSVCANGLCICPGGEQIKNDICIPIDSQADPDQPCEEGITVCTGNSQCLRGVCRCPEGQISLNGQCARVVTSFTMAPINCNPTCGQNSFCYAGNCQCFQGYQLNNGQCQPACNPQCQPNAYCQQGRCQCNTGFVPNGNQCLPQQYPVPSLQPNAFTGAPGQPCDLRPGAMLCRERALCVMQQCICPTQLVLSNGRCVDFVGDAFPGQSCATPGIICRGGASCDQGICKCAYGYSPILNQCTMDFVFTFRPNPLTTQLPPVFELRPGAICDARCEFEPCLQRCGGGSYCVSGRCTCPFGTYEFEGTCIPLQIDPATSRFPTTTPSFITIRTARPGDNCDNSIRCNGGSSCILGTCLCPNGYEINFDRTSCISTSIVNLRPRSYPGENCSLDADCEGNSFCLGKVCQCHSDEEVKDKSCKTRQSSGVANPGSPCTSSSICQSGSICSRDYCTCQEGSTTNSTGHCVQNILSDTSSALPGAPCRGGGPPCEGSSYCNDGFCLCLPGSVSKNGKCTGNDGTRATPPKGLGDYCALQTDCGSILHATCLNYRCSCSASYEQKDGQCVLKSNGSKKQCSSFRDCDSPRVCSRNNVCECPFTMSETDNGICIYTDNAGQLGRPVADRLTHCPLDNSCKLPECFCSRTGTVAPGGFMSKDVPQMVVLAFDDPITDRTINIYKSMFSGKHRNPNGCPIKGTFFVSHQFNNYDQTQWLHSRGNEIALNSITHENLMNATKERWRHEMVGLRESLKGFSYVEETSMIGIRAPHLLMGGDAQFDMMKENGFLYDSSMPVREGPVWPQTLDHKLAWDCGEQNCPTRPHKGIWEIPLQLLISQEGIWHSVARTAIKPHYSREGVNRFLQRNFYRNYNGNRAPFILNAESDFLTYLPDNGVVHAIDDFLKHILSKEDVFVVTISQMIEWMRRPVSSENINKFKPWQCNFRMNDHVQPCETPSICSYDSRSPAGIPHSFRVCGSCPKSYPWIEDPLGKKQLKK